jgi:hypothetical protein
MPTTSYRQPKAQAHRRRDIAWLVLVMLTGSLLAVERPTSVSAERWTASCRPWRVVPASQIGPGQLNDVSGTSSTDVWAVGTEVDSSTPIIGHWDGTSWTSSPPGVTNADLNDVAAISSTDAWVVGIHFIQGNIPLALHWDGVGWSSVHMPGAGSYDFVYGVSAVSSTDVWAVGSFSGVDGKTHALTEHWDGATWSVIHAPDASKTLTWFYSVAAISSSDVWAVGFAENPSGGLYVPVAEHWDGTSWSVVATPTVDDNDTFYGVSGSSGNDVWAVGGLTLNGTSIVEHWNGTVWFTVPIDTRGTRGFGFYDLASLSPDDAWGVGVAGYPGSSYAIAEHWDGNKWQLAQVKSPQSMPVFFGADATSPTDIWAVGAYSSGLAQPLVEHSRGTCP